TIAMPRELPIFPLPIVLFPGAPQPLHIFEPRYRQLLQDCLAGDRRFGIAYVAPDPAPDADPVPNPGDVGCVALIQSNQPLPDGRGATGVAGATPRSSAPRDRRRERGTGGIAGRGAQ